MKALLPFFTPTKVALIDDNYDMLTILANGLSLKSATYQIFTNPILSLEFINQNTKTNILNQTPQATDKLILGHLESFYDQVFKKIRFEQISTIIVDYDMPGINGIELSEKIASPHIQKIMLTGAANEQLAVKAFNKKSIDYFVRKDNPKLTEELEKLIIQTQNKYFSSLTQDLTSIISYKALDSMGITDPVFIEFFHKFIAEKKISEYYLLDSIGTYLLLSEDGNPSILFMFDELNFPDYEDTIPLLDQSSDIVQDIDNYKKAICYYESTNSLPYDEKKWKDYLFPLHPLQGRQTYYWAYAPTLPYFNKDDIVSFKKYKQTLEQA